MTLTKENIAIVLILLLGAAAWLRAPHGADARMVPAGDHAVTNLAVLELFTSQSCSSCPPADRVLADFAAQENVIALSCHVTYWDHLWWKDTLAQKFCTDRQSRYAQSAGRSRVFTPEAIVNGRHSINGSDAKGIQRLMEGRGSIKKIDIAADGTGYRISVPDISGNKAWLFVMGRDVTENIKRGENGGRSIHYVRPVIALRNLGIAKGQAVHIEKSDLPANTAGFAVLVQRGSQADGVISAAGQAFFE